MPEFDFTSGFFDKLLKNIGRSTRSLVMNTDKRIVFSHFNASPDHAVHLLFHLCIAALDSIKIELFFVLALQFAGGRTSAYTNAVSRAAYLNDQHPFLGFGLQQT